MEEAAASLGASVPVVVRHIVLPNLLPAILSGSALGFARCIGEFGSVVLIAGNIPYRTELASVYIYGQVEADAAGAAAAVSVVLLVAALGLLAAFDLLRRRVSRHAEPVA
jgi:sulfate/thiosulfate transport system permease protein